MSPLRSLPARVAAGTLAGLALLLTAPSVGHAASSRFSTAPTITGTTGRTLRYCVIGDSITARGSFASTPSKTFANLLLARLQSQRGSVVRVDATSHHDASGSTTLATIDVIPTACDITLLGLGTNDARELNSDGSYVYGNVTVNANAMRLMDRIVVASPDTVLIAVGVWSPSGVRTARVDALIGGQVMQHGGTYSVISDLYDTPSLRLPTRVPAFGGYQTDGFHPNDAGHVALESRVAQDLNLVSPWAAVRPAAAQLRNTHRRS